MMVMVFSEIPFDKHFGSIFMSVCSSWLSLTEKHTFFSVI